MIANKYPFLLPINIEEDLPTRLRALAADLELIRKAEAPTQRQYDEAPFIDRWRATTDAAGLRLTGLVANHPRLRPGPAMTTQLWSADPHGKWVRTLSRFYRLGRPLPPARQADHDYDPDQDFRDV